MFIFVCLLERRRGVEEGGVRRRERMRKGEREKKRVMGVIGKRMFSRSGVGKKKEKTLRV